MVVQLLNGLKGLHEKSICHRDIKCANIFSTKAGIIKLGDFNVSKVAKQGLMHTQTGTPYYASPEVWKERPYDWRSDMWSLGCVIYEIATLKPPFRANDMKGLYKKVITGDYIPISSRYSSDLQSLISSMLQVNPRNRPSADQLMNMPYVQKNINDRQILDLVRGNMKTAAAMPVHADKELLETIKMPRVLRQLQDKLPKANYNRQRSQPANVGREIMNSVDCMKTKARDLAPRL